MTLGQFFDLLSQNPSILIFYFVSAPLTALLSLIFGKGEGNRSPWKYLYSFLIYFVSIPGIFAITLNAYLFLFERQSIFNANIYTQILPIICMIITLWLINRNADFNRIPGFDRIGGLMFIITCLLIIMWILEKTHIFAITFIPFHYFILLLFALLILLRIGWSKMFSD